MKLASITVCAFGYLISSCHCNHHAQQLYEDLMYTYNRVVRPVKNASEVLTVRFGASLIRIIDVDSKNQVFTTNLWLELQWQDSKLTWDPEEYGGIKKVHMPSDQIWTPDIVLYNNAAGDPEISIYTDALVYYDGTIVWKPPAIYKSFCAINVIWFPYDSQDCEMKFGLWTHTGKYVDLRQLPMEQVIAANHTTEHGETRIVEYLENGMDLSYFYTNAEWDLLNLTSKRHEEVYSTCCGPETYVDIRYYFDLRRKPLFYTVNLIVPCALISFLTTFVFYLPADPGGHQLTFSISILVTLTVFFLVLIELIPPTSLVIPLFGKYLLFTMILVTLSIIISVMTVNCHHRSGSTHIMPHWVRLVFLGILPKLLSMQRPAPDPKARVAAAKFARMQSGDSDDRLLFDESMLSPLSDNFRLPQLNPYDGQVPSLKKTHSNIIIRVIRNVQFISNHLKRLEEEDEISNEWSFVAMVIDRLFLLVFTITNLIGTALIILQAPTLYDTKKPLSIPTPTKPLGGDTLGPMYFN